MKLRALANIIYAVPDQILNGAPKSASISCRDR